MLLDRDTLQGINISHLGKRKIIFKMPFWGDMLVPWRVFLSTFGAKDKSVSILSSFFLPKDGKEGGEETKERGVKNGGLWNDFWFLETSKGLPFCILSCLWVGRFMPTQMVPFLFFFVAKRWRTSAYQSISNSQSNLQDVKMEEPVKVELSDEEKALMYRKLELSDLTDRNSARMFFHFFHSDIITGMFGWHQTIWDILSPGMKNQVPTYKKPTKKWMTGESGRWSDHTV